MSNSRLDALRLAYDALARGNRSAAAAVLHDDFALVAPPGWTGAERTYLGAVGLGRYLDEHRRHVDDYRWVPLQLFELDEGRLVALIQEEGFTRNRRIAIEPRPAAHAWTMPGSFATRLEIHCDNPLFADGARLAADGF